MNVNWLPKGKYIYLIYIHKNKNKRKF